MTTLLIYRDGQYVQATETEVQAALQALGAAPAAHSHTADQVGAAPAAHTHALMMTQAERDQLAGLPGVLDVKADLGADGKLKASQLPASALVDIKATGMTLAAGVLTLTQDDGGPSAVVDLNSFATDAEVSAALQGKASLAQGRLAETAVQPGALGPVATMSLAQAQAAVSGDRTRKIMRTDTPSADSVAGINTIVPFGLLATQAATAFTKLAVVASKKPFTALQVGYIHLGGGGAASIKVAVASTDDPGAMNFALGGSDATFRKCVTPRKAGVEYNTYSANGWQKVAFGGVSSDVTAVAIADTGSAASVNIAMSDVTPCASVVAADGLYYALIRVYDGAAPCTRGGIGYTGITTGTQYQDDAGFAKFMSVYRGIDGVTDPSVWNAAMTPSFSDTTQPPLIVRFVQGSIDGDAPVTGMMCGDSRFDATAVTGIDATSGYRGTSFLLAQALNASGKNHHLIRACGGGYTSALYYDRGSKLLAVSSPAWAVYTVYTINDGVPTQAIIDAAKLRAQQFVRICAAKNVRVGLVTAYPLTGITAPQYALLAALDAWAANTGLPYYSPLAAYGNPDGTWQTGLNIDGNHMTAAQYRVYAADLKAWLLTWAGV